MIMVMTFDDFRKDVLSFVQLKPKGWRDGQAVFNFIDEVYGVAHFVQFNHHIDCFYNDDLIEEFIKASYDVYVEHSKKENIE